MRIWHFVYRRIKFGWIMKKGTVFFVAFLVIFSQQIYCSADTIVLADGVSITGAILAEKPEKLIIDIGVTVLAIPREKIKRFSYSDSEPVEVNDLQHQAEQSSHLPDQLYHTANLKKITIENCYDLFSEAVVEVRTPAGLGSGFFINQAGYLITNYHVIEKETKIEVVLFEQSQHGLERKSFKKVKIEAINPFIDLALLKVEDLGETQIKYAYLGDVERVRVGEEVFAIGSPMGLERSVTDGAISTKNREFQGLVYIQTTAPINPGNSGGPLFNLAGEVVGVTNMGYIFLDGLGFAIPIDYVKHFVDNREAFAYDKDNPNTGYKYIQPGKRLNANKPTFIQPGQNTKTSKNKKHK